MLNRSEGVLYATAVLGSMSIAGWIANTIITMLWGK